MNLYKKILDSLDKDFVHVIYNPKINELGCCSNLWRLVPQNKFYVDFQGLKPRIISRDDLASYEHIGKVY